MTNLQDTIEFYKTAIAKHKASYFAMSAGELTSRLGRELYNNLYVYESRLRDLLNDDDDKYDDRVKAIEAGGLSRSDAQAIVAAEDLKAGR